MQNDFPDEQLTYSIPHAAKVTDTSRSTIYRAIKEGDLASIKVGGRRLISKEARLERLRWATGRGSIISQSSQTFGSGFGHLFACDNRRNRPWPKCAFVGYLWEISDRESYSSYNSLNWLVSPGGLEPPFSA